jgi:predicted house-cleaning noncanonical NTP pyrophosphatase (MazG superfamily)
MQRDEKDPSKDQDTSIVEVPHREKKRRRPRPLTPLRSITVITKEGPADFSGEEIFSEHIGWKAYGLASLPSEWVPPFFVIAASCFERGDSDEAIDAWVAECIARFGIGEDRLVMVRSSGSSETIQTRGRLKSMSCSPNEVVSAIRNLIPQLSQMPGGKVHWIVQEYISARQKGLLSNERRLREEKRDWVAEFEPQGERRGFTQPIGIRRWRDGTDLAELELSCTSEFEVTLRLRRVAMWATELSTRTLFEWVWDGKAVRIVQADQAEVATGSNPRSLFPTHIPSGNLASLKVFHQARQEDYQLYSKLRNARLYGELGYHMPVFYVIDDPRVIERILFGEIPSPLEGDLVELTKRPLIIRTDGTGNASEKSEMLPRSDLLPSYAQARDWLFTDFRAQIKKSGLTHGDVCLIAHHFIPSVASAWARAEPGNRIVRVESLWGIPEGLYWYSHDTFEVDTKTVDINFGRPSKPLEYKVWEHLRYKGTFIQPQDDGKWEPYHTMPPYDWKRSISERSWLFEIAHTTRRVAECEKYAVSVMWFVDNHPQATEHKVLPWFHSKSELAGPPKAAPRQKRKSASDISIRNIDDWQRLQQALQSAGHIERVVVEPIDPELIRNPDFAKELGDLAAAKKFVVELFGGILSHVYYILQSSGAQVECIDLFGAEEDVVEYNKIVRDKIPTLIEGRGERVETVQLGGNALRTALQQKLVEEAFEALDAKSGEELVGELADVQEVIKALCRTLGMNTTDIEAERKEKEKRRGGFETGLMLTKTTTPHSIQKQPTIAEPPSLGLKMQHSSEPVISDVADLPAKPLYRRPDLRQVNQQLEKMFTFEVEANKIEEIKETLEFSMPMNDQRQENLTLTVELRRTHSSVRGIVRLRLHRPLQLNIKFPK